MLSEFDHFKILEQKGFRQGHHNRNRNDGVTTALKPSRTTASLTLLTLIRKPKKGSVRPANTAL